MIKPTRLLVNGAGGRMGRYLVELISQNDQCHLVGAIEASNHPNLGRDVGLLSGVDPLGIMLSAELVKTLEQAEVVIDFTRPEITEQVLAECRRQKKGLVTGTTGMNAEQKQRLESEAKHIPIIAEPNFSSGIALMLELVSRAARVEEDADVEILDLHHSEKIDAPSGTALKLGETISNARGGDFKQDTVMARTGRTGQRKKGSLGFAVLRAGDAVGDHTVIFATPGERLEITHRAFSRIAFARGAIKAALWLARQAPGLYSMRDMQGNTEVSRKGT